MHTRHKELLSASFTKVKRKFDSFINQLFRLAIQYQLQYPDLFFTPQPAFSDTSKSLQKERQIYPKCQPIEIGCIPPLGVANTGMPLRSHHSTSVSTNALLLLSRRLLRVSWPAATDVSACVSGSRIGTARRRPHGSSRQKVRQVGRFGKKVEIGAKRRRSDRWFLKRRARSTLLDAPNLPTWRTFCRQCPVSTEIRRQNRASKDKQQLRSAGMTPLCLALPHLTSPAAMQTRVAPRR